MMARWIAKPTAYSEKLQVSSPCQLLVNLAATITHQICNGWAS